MNKFNGQAGANSGFPQKSGEPKIRCEDENIILTPGIIPPAALAAGVAAYERWYAAGGQDDHAIDSLICLVVSAVREAAGKVQE